jgi:hypothetical protein
VSARISGLASCRLRFYIRPPLLEPFFHRFDPEQPQPPGPPDTSNRLDIPRAPRSPPNSPRPGRRETAGHYPIAGIYLRSGSVHNRRVGIGRSIADVNTPTRRAPQLQGMV